MKAYRVSGRFRMGQEWQAYAKEVAAPDEASARERVLSILGSQHAVLRKYITIDTIAEVPPAELQDHAVRFAAEGKA